MNESTKEIRKLLRKLERAGVKVEKSSGSSHYKVYAPKGIVIISSSPRNSKAVLQNIRRDLRRNGVEFLKK